MKTTSIEFSNNTITITLPESELRHISREEMEELNQKERARLKDMCGSFAPLILECIAARKQACLNKLMQHLSEAAHEFTGFAWKRKDGSSDHFCPQSFDVMTQIEECVKCGNWDDILSTPHALDQIIKSLLNMPNLDHSDRGGFRFSEFVSYLMECFAVSIQK